MPVWICATCANHYPDQESPPRDCVICSDERQWVPSSGQRWTTAAELAGGHRSDVREVEPGLLGIGTDPPVAIGQRALVIQTPKGNLLWDPPGFLDEQAIAKVRDIGGLRAVTASHPHFYGSIVEWSRAFGGVLIYLHEADREWVQHHDPAIVFWSGETHSLNEDLTLIRVGGHFSGFQAMHWASGEQGTGALMTGDMPQVCPDRRYVSFMYSYPNFIPVDGATVRHIVATLERYNYSKLYGAWPGFVVSGDAKLALRRSAERYLRAIGDCQPLDAACPPNAQPARAK